MDDPSTIETEGFGLMDYNARWYDPMTGRFAQADTIVPGGVQGLDRYAYVGNNPLRYVDPSGHSYCDSEFAFEEDCKDEPVGGGGGGGGGSGGVELTEDGKKVLELFEWYRDTPGWWNDYGTKPFGIAEFLGLWLMFEAAGNMKVAGILSIAAAQLLFVGFPTTEPYCNPGESCFNAVLNFIAHNIDENSSLWTFGSDKVNNYDQNHPGINYNSISEIGHKALDPGTVKIWDQEKGISIWGNLKDPAAIAKILSMLPQDRYGNYLFDETEGNVVYYWEDNFFIFTYEQYVFFQTILKTMGMDMALLGE